MFLTAVEGSFLPCQQPRVWVYITVIFVDILGVGDVARRWNARLHVNVRNKKERVKVRQVGWEG